MHLDISLPLLSELEQLRRAFWQNHNHQNHSHYQDETLDSHNQQTHNSSQSPDPKQHLENANNYIKPNDLTQSQNQYSTPDSHSDGEQHTHDSTEHGHSCSSRECKDHSQDKSQTFCRSTSTDSGENGSETYERNNLSGQPKAQDEPSQPLQVNNSLLGPSNRPRRTCRALWDISTEDSCFL